MTAKSPLLPSFLAAMSAAQRALDAWRNLSGPARAEHLHRWAAVLADRQEPLALAMTREVGKPITESRGEAARCVAILRYYAGEAVRNMGDVIPAQTAGALQFSLHQSQSNRQLQRSRLLLTHRRPLLLWLRPARLCLQRIWRENWRWAARHQRH